MTARGAALLQHNRNPSSSALFHLSTQALSVFTDGNSHGLAELSRHSVWTSAPAVACSPGTKFSMMVLRLESFLTSLKAPLAN